MVTRHVKCLFREILLCMLLYLDKCLHLPAELILQIWHVATTGGCPQLLLVWYVCVCVCVCVCVRVRMRVRVCVFQKQASSFQAHLVYVVL